MQWLLSGILLNPFLFGRGWGFFAVGFFLFCFWCFFLGGGCQHENFTSVLLNKMPESLYHCTSQSVYMQFEITFISCFLESLLHQTYDFGTVAGAGMGVEGRSAVGVCHSG